MPHSVWQRLATARRAASLGMPRLLVQGGLLHQQLAAPAVLVAIGNATENQAVRLPDLLIGRGLHAQRIPVRRERCRVGDHERVVQQAERLWGRRRLLPPTDARAPRSVCRRC